MTPEEQNLDMLVAELDRENRLLRARNERLEKEAEQRKPWVGLTDEEREQHRDEWRSNIHDKEFRAIEAKLREKNH
mgnify:CR=1 FL=1|jgi:hypothetical protein